MYFVCRRESVAGEEVAGVDAGSDVGEVGGGAVGQDGAAQALELGQVVDHTGAEEGGAVGEGGLVDDDGGALGLDALHDALNGRLAEVVGVRLHGETVDAHGAFLLGGGAEGAAGGVVVPSGHAQHAVGDEVLAGAVALDDGRHHVLGHVGIVGQQLLGVLGEAVAAVAEGGVVVVGADARVEADALDDGAGVEALDLGVGVEFVEVAHAQGQVGVGEELHGLGLLHAHEQRGDVLLLGPLLQQGGEGAGGLGQCRYVGDGTDGAVLLLETRVVDELGRADDDARGVKVVVQRLALAQELGGEEQVEAADALGGVAQVERAAVAHGDGGFYDHHGRGVDREHKVDDLLDVRGVEVVLLGVVVGGGGYDNEIGIAVGRGAVECGREVERLFGQIALDVVVLDGRPAPVDHLHLFGDDVDGRYMVVLGQQRGDAHPHVARPGHRYVVFLFHLLKVFAEELMLRPSGSGREERPPQACEREIEVEQNVGCLRGDGACGRCAELPEALLGLVREVKLFITGGQARQAVEQTVAQMEQREHIGR